MPFMQTNVPISFTIISHCNEMTEALIIAILQTQSTDVKHWIPKAINDIIQIQRRHFANTITLTVTINLF